MSVDDRVRFDRKAAAAYERIPLSLLDDVDRHLRSLAESRATLSQPAVSPPFPSGWLMYDWSVRDYLAFVWHSTALFLRAADEEGIRVIGLTVRNNDPAEQDPMLP